jgi:hypothetical protein
MADVYKVYGINVPYRKTRDMTCFEERRGNE